jgi:hypothetical protein
MEVAGLLGRLIRGFGFDTVDFALGGSLLLQNSSSFRTTKRTSVVGRCHLSEPQAREGLGSPTL